MVNLEHFNEEQIYRMNHYEIINYIADYVQNFYNTLFPSEKINFPIFVPDILNKLEINLKKVTAGWFIEKDSRFYSITSQAYYSVEDRTIYYYEDLELKYYYFNTILFNSLAHYIMPKESQPNLRRNNFGVLPFTFYNDMQQMLVSSLILPWKQAISFFLEENISVDIENRLSLYDHLTCSQEDLFDLPSNYVEKLAENYLRPMLGVSLNEVFSAYSQFNRILEAKRILVPRELENEEYREFTRILAKYI